MKQSLLDTLKQARDALLNAGSSSYSANQLSEAAANLAGAISELEKAEPVAWVIRTDNTNLHELDPNKTCSWLDFDVEQFKHNAARSLKIVDAAPLYTHPAPAITEGWREAMQEFVDRVECGEVRSKYTYSKFKALLAAAPEPKP